QNQQTVSEQLAPLASGRQAITEKNNCMIIGRCLSNSLKKGFALSVGWVDDGFRIMRQPSFQICDPATAGDQVYRRYQSNHIERQGDRQRQHQSGAPGFAGFQLAVVRRYVL
ncbi:MAG TPA: hypothetical protein VKR43_01270, partial [Bryobacteraceae bacterium]|nr:hypothetical protein [Bryobacteraceae bacterium]